MKIEMLPNVTISQMSLSVTDIRSTASNRTSLIFKEELLEHVVLPKALLSACSGGNQNTNKVRKARKTAGIVSIYVENIIFLLNIRVKLSIA